jgi:urease accessory protein UreE
MFRGPPSIAVIDDVQNSDQGPSSIAVIDGPPIFAGQISAKMIPPLMSLTLRKEKRKEARKRKKTKKQNDLRLLLDKKNTQKQSENFYCTKDMLL